jgi:hypothetical protein
MVETCQVLEFTATARENSEGGTRFGMIAWPAGIENARAMPKTTITANTGQTTRGRERERKQCQRAEKLERDAQRENAHAVVPVRDVPGGQDKQHERQELRETDESEVERIARDRIHLPADRDGLHLHRDRCEQPRREEAREGRVLEQPAEWRALLS